MLLCSDFETLRNIFYGVGGGLIGAGAIVFFVF